MLNTKYSFLGRAVVTPVDRLLRRTLVRSEINEAKYKQQHLSHYSFLLSIAATNGRAAGNHFLRGRYTFPAVKNKFPAQEIYFSRQEIHHRFATVIFHSKRVKNAG